MLKRIALQDCADGRLTTIQDNTMLKLHSSHLGQFQGLTTIQDNTMLKLLKFCAAEHLRLTTIQDNTMLKPQIEYFCAPHAEIRMTVKRILMVL